MNQHLSFCVALNQSSPSIICIQNQYEAGDKYGIEYIASGILESDKVRQ